MTLTPCPVRAPRTRRRGTRSGDGAPLAGEVGGLLDDSVAEHAGVVDALAAGDGDLAASLVLEHLDRLIAETTAFLDRHDTGLVDRLLAASS